MNSITTAFVAAARLQNLVRSAACNGGFHVSAGGGTANVAAGEISRTCGVSYEDAHHALDVMGGNNYYQDWADAQFSTNPRWDIRTISRAATRPFRSLGKACTQDLSP